MSTQVQVLNPGSMTVQHTVNDVTIAQVLVSYLAQYGEVEAKRLTESVVRVNVPHRPGDGPTVYLREVEHA